MIKKLIDVMITDDVISETDKADLLKAWKLRTEKLALTEVNNSKQLNSVIKHIEEHEKNF
jgi:pyruvate kinase